MPVDKRDIVRISKILEKVQGNDENNLDEIMDEEEQTPIVASTLSVSSLISSNMQDEQEVGTVENENSRQEGSPVLISSDSDSSEVQISKSTKKSRTKGFFRVCELKKPCKTDEKQAALLHFNTFLR
ncbi:hypothetical protein RN001_001895 [Aquatica leii]|uniref:Uncharacterized protein n=1 Tax=Aquatica leii TaxID=1421715 RepID=A0AAN7PGF5_9COLE|nr:hypothetical protein RN001_001895 [Aquatica leii]